MARAFTGHGRRTGNIDQRALGGVLVHQAHAFAAAQEGAREIDADDPLPMLIRGVDQGVDRAHTGVVDQNVQPPEARFDCRHGSHHRGAVGDIAGQCQGVLAQAFDRLPGSLQVDVGRHHPSAGLGKALGDRPAHALPGTGDQGHCVR